MTIDFPIWIKFILGVLGFLYVIYYLLKIEKNKFKCFDKQFVQLTGALTLDKYMEKLKSENHTKTASLVDMDASLNKLKNLPTARLERCFAGCAG